MYDTVLILLSLASSLKYFFYFFARKPRSCCVKITFLKCFFLYAFLRSFSTLFLRFEVSLRLLSSMPLLKTGLPTIFCHAVLSLGTEVNCGIVVEENTPRGNAAVGVLFFTSKCAV